MAELRDVTQKLAENNAQNMVGHQYTANQIARLSDRFDNFFRYLKEQQPDKLEDRREAENRRKESQSSAAEARASSSQRGGGNNNSGFLNNISLPAALASVEAAKAFSKKLLRPTLKKAIPIAVATAFADDIEAWVTSETGSKEIGQAAARASIGGAFGLALGRRFGALGVIIGAVATEDNIKEFKNLGTALQERINGFLTSIDDFVKSDAGKGVRDFFERIGIDITAITTAFPSMESILVGLQKGVGDGLKAITGFVEGGFDNEEFQKNWKQGVGLLSGVILAIKPLRRMVLGLARFALKTPLGRTITAVGLGTLAVTELFDGDDEFSEADLTAAIGLTLGAGAAAVAATRKLRANRANPGRGGAGGNTAAAGSLLAAPQTVTKSGRVLGEVFETKKGGRMMIKQGPHGGLYAESVSKDTPLGKPSQKWWGKFPRIRGLVGAAGPLGAVLAAIDSFRIASVMNDNSLTEDQKIFEAGRILGGSIGGLSGLAIGGLIGGPLGAAILSTGGFFAGEYLGPKVANWLFGGTNKLTYKSPMAKLAGAGMDNYNFAFSDDGMGYGMDKMIRTIPNPPISSGYNYTRGSDNNMSASQLRDYSTSAMQYRPSTAGNVVVGDTSTYVDQGTTFSLLNGLGSVDKSFMFAQE